MKHSWLLVLMLLGIILMGAIPAGAASGAGPYYAIPSWDQTIDPSTRFVVLSNFNNQAVLDRETGLVWEQSPTQYIYNWYDAQNHCINLSLGNRFGWRLPSVHELLTLIDPSRVNNNNAPTYSSTLFTGNPFGSQGAFGIAYWTSTTDPTTSTNAWLGCTGPSNPHAAFSDNKSYPYCVWCVRSGTGHNPQ